MHLKPRAALLPAAPLSLLLLLPQPLLANNGLKALGALYTFLMIVGLCAFLPALVGFGLAIANLSRKRKGLRIASIVCTVPLLVLAVLAVPKLPQAGAVCMVGVLINGSLIMAGIRQS